MLKHFSINFRDRPKRTSLTAALRSAFPQGATHRHTVHASHPCRLGLGHSALDCLADGVVQLSR